MSRRAEQIGAEMSVAREKTLWLLNQVPDEFLTKRVHSFYSPIGWHFGHIARTEEYWIICRALGRACLDGHLSFLFADLPENPKDNRVNLPSRVEIIDYLARIRQATLSALRSADLESGDPFLADGYGWEFALQHECQHQETICEMMQLIQKASPSSPPLNEGPGGSNEGIPGNHVPPLLQRRGDPSFLGMTSIAGGPFIMGSDDQHGYDNEKRAHEVRVEAFELAETPVTAMQWMAFMTEEGYSRPDLWTQEGWAWRENEGATMPEYWIELDGEFRYFGPHGLREIHAQEPVSCVSWYEADAFARWTGMRLPTEAEWEFAARGPSSFRFPWGDRPPAGRASFAMSSWGPEPVGSYSEGASPFGVLDMAGNVWEWTSSPFSPYPGFEAFPYDGYSKDHMAGLHRVCRGGSWATSAKTIRSSFRNWYVPSYRQGFLGLRLARSV